MKSVILQSVVQGYHVSASRGGRASIPAAVPGRLPSSFRGRIRAHGCKISFGRFDLTRGIPTTARSSLRGGRGIPVRCSNVQFSLSEIERMRAELPKLEEERDEALKTGRIHSQRIDKLKQRLQGLQTNAEAAMKSRNEDAARQMLQDKAQVVEAMKDAEDKARINFSLAAKLDALIGQKEMEVMKMIRAVREQLDARPAYSSPSYSAPSYSSPASTSPPPVQQGRPSRPLSDAEAERAFRELEAEVGVERLKEDRQLGQEPRFGSEADLNDAFLRMERRMLEDMMRASASRAASSEGARSATVPPAGPPPVDRAPSGPSTLGGPGLGSGGGSSQDRPFQIPSWWAGGEDTLRQIRHQLVNANEEECRVSAQEASTLLARLVDSFRRVGEARVADMVDVIHLTEQAKHRDMVVQLPIDFAPNVRVGLYRILVTALLSALYKDAPLVPSAPHPLTPQQAQAYAVAMAVLLKLEVEDASKLVDAAVAANARGALLDAIASMRKEPSTDAVWDASVVAARKLQRVLVAFSPPATSAEVRLVNEGLRGLVKESEARCLIAAYRSIRMQGELEEEQAGLRVLEAALPLL